LSLSTEPAIVRTTWQLLSAV